jgi:integrase
MKQLQIRVLFDRKGQATNKKAALVQLEIRYDKERKFLGTGVKVFKGQFKNGRVVGREDADLLNDKINTLYSRIMEIGTNCIREHRAFSFSMLNSLSETASETAFLDFCHKRTEEKRSAAASRKNNRLFCRILEKYGLIRTFSDINTRAIHLFDDYLKTMISERTGEPLSASTISVYHSCLRMFISEAVSFGHIESNPYSQIRQGRPQPKPRTVLTLEELQLLRTYIPPTKSRRIALDFFLIQCYTGLSFSDLMATDFTTAENHNGNLILPRTTRVKTGTQFYIVLLPFVVDILKRHEYKLPQITLSAYSQQLALIEEETGIGKHITSHVGRHTFATSVALGSGIPIEVVSKMLGHTNIQTTQQYAKIMPKQVMEGFTQIKKVVS